MKNISSQFTNFYQQLSIPTAKRTDRIAAIELHKYVVGAIGIFCLFAIGFAVAIHRCDRAGQIVRERSMQTHNASIPAR